VKIKFNNDFSKAFRSIKEYKELKVDEIISATEKVVNELDGKAKNIKWEHINVIKKDTKIENKEEEKQSIKSFNLDIAKNQRQIEELNKIISDLRHSLLKKQTNTGDISSEGIPKEKVNKDEATDFDNQMKIIERALDRLKEENTIRMNKVIQSINIIKAHEDLVKSIKDKLKKGIDERTHKMLIYKNTKIVSDAEAAEKSLILRDINEYIKEIKIMKEEIKGKLKKNEKIKKVKEIVSGVKKSAVDFQMEKMMTMFDFKPIEEEVRLMESKIEEARVRLEVMKFNVTKTQTDFENELTSKEIELESIISSIKSTQDEISSVLELSEVHLLIVKTTLKKRLHSEVLITSECKECEEGKIGNVKLKCGHCMCIKCTVKQRIGGLEDGDNKVQCRLCEGKRDIEFVVMSCGCKEYPEKVKGATFNFVEQSKFLSANDIEITNPSCSNCQIKYNLKEMFAVWGGRELSLSNSFIYYRT